MLLQGRALQQSIGALVVRRRGDRIDPRVRRPVSRRPAAAQERRACGRRGLLLGAARRAQLLAPSPVREPAPGIPGRARLLRGLPHAREGMILIAGSLGVVTALIALDGAGAGSLFRHAYFLPVVVAALRFGAPGGTLAAGAAVLLDAPFVLPAIERSGLTAASLDGLVTFVMLALVGTLSGALRARAARHRRRYELLATLQRTLADEVTLDVALARLRAALAGRLGVDDLVLVARDETGLVIAGGERVAPGSLVARVLETGASEFARIGGSGA